LTPDGRFAKVASAAVLAVDAAGGPSRRRRSMMIPATGMRKAISMTITRRARGVRKWLLAGLCGACFQAAGAGCPTEVRTLVTGLVVSVGSTFISSYVNDVLNVPPSVRF
jgi:hypothetical protein